MPIWDYKCPKEGCDGFKFDVYVPLHSSESPTCGDCGNSMERTYSLALEHRAASGYPFITRNIRPDGKPVEVTSPGHLRELCRTFGVTQRDDVAYITKEYLGYDVRTGKQKYKEGSGVGNPGCWI